ncbi:MULTISPECIES: DUF934 domain-containing protein [unclassified Oceanobacter]|jgi:uncharacterized protein (DUF934 family)|uniref:DUF934 domain-containing protein n=1 Tax=unclassified Oceanobacter TaxID=2620260 RepID=UPI002734489E|nr:MULTISPECIES: DUF934 domain-containing protein [unclassified Oceanobacter]MDP2504315.1 DUF934 domain-containing protein [Oceanobacter sp. 3_MG-2023]MDP2608507.1 DUF934 domain-containing protein [Oceanobacter sp. 1_MG-2023]MDP2611731.1 DUF934 domain-containing protein [Oceanobacter sp. 2_MG-2023]
MAKLIKDGAFVADDVWTRIDDDAIATEYSLISLDRWTHQQAELQPLASRGKLGLYLNSDQLAEMVAEQCRNFAVIAVDFPKFSDGRGYSTARLLRDQYHYAGDLRAVGDVLIDQLFFMKRVGFSSYALRDDQNEAHALAAFSSFSQPYQAAMDDQRPLFARVSR